MKDCISPRERGEAMPLLVQADCLDQPLFLRSTERRRGRFARLLCDMVAAVGSSTNATDTRYRETSDATLVETKEFVITDK